MPVLFYITGTRWEKCSLSPVGIGDILCLQGEDPCERMKAQQNTGTLLAQKPLTKDSLSHTMKVAKHPRHMSVIGKEKQDDG